MALVDTPTPKLTIHESAKPYIEYTYFDDSHYAGYLHGRGVTEEQLASLRLTVTDEGLGPLALANFGRDGDNRLIRFSARRMPGNIYEQNNLLFHESEHFIWENRHPNAQNAKATLILGSFVVGSIGLGGMMGTEAFNVTEGLPLAVRSASALVTGAVSAVIGGVSSVHTSNMFYQEISPNEINARRAAKREVARNPEILKIIFKQRVAA